MVYVKGSGKGYRTSNLPLTPKETSLLNSICEYRKKNDDSCNDFLCYLNEGDRSQGAVLRSLERRGLVQVLENDGIDDFDFRSKKSNHIRQYDVYCGDGYSRADLDRILQKNLVRNKGNVDFRYTDKHEKGSRV